MVDGLGTEYPGRRMYNKRKLFRKKKKPKREKG